MKKISLLLMVSASSLFLTGCWKRKKKDVIDTKVSGIVLASDESHKTVPDKVETIEYVDGSQEYLVGEVKTIFADDEIIIPVNEVIPAANNEQTFLDQLNIQTVTSPEIEKNILIEEKQKESVGIVYFDFDVSEDVKNQSKDTLKLIVNKLNELIAVYPNLEISIEGHACNSCGSERYNLVLSDDRAKTVKKKIVESTVIPSERIFETGYGTSHMIVSGNRAEQAPNRRAEIFVILK
jgi:outer membrane protein OmpA-like peptidoglycan-associated protein